MKILVLGFFGYLTNQIDGQTIKTRDVYSLLKTKCTEEIVYFDTQSFKTSKLNLLKMLLMVLKADNIFYLPAHNNLKYLFPIIYLLSKISNTKLNYLVVGGWLFEFLKNKPLHRYILKNIEGIYTETDNLYMNLQKYNLNNLNKLHNFRIVDFPNIHDIDKSKKEIRLVFMARVHPLKGTDLLFEIEKRLNDMGMHHVSIDIYGPIFKDYEEDFLRKIENSSVKYCGVVDPSNVYLTLQDYDLMLFPTKYYTEGFPGTILDAYISLIPVVASNWLNAKEFIDDKKTGYIIDFNNDEFFIEKVIDLVKNPNYIYSLKDNIKDKRNHYSYEKAWEILEKTIHSN